MAAERRPCVGGRGRPGSTGATRRPPECVRTKKYRARTTVSSGVIVEDRPRAEAETKHFNLSMRDPPRQLADRRSRTGFCLRALGRGMLRYEVPQSAIAETRQFRIPRLPVDHMQPATLKALEFDRVVAALRSLALTPLGDARLADAGASDERRGAVASSLELTSEAVRFLTDTPGLSAPRAVRHRRDPGRRRWSRAGRSNRCACSAWPRFSSPWTSARTRSAARPGRPSRACWRSSGRDASFEREIGDVRRAIDPNGRACSTTPARRSARSATGCASSATRLRGTLESYLRSRDTSKYLQEQVITDRNGRYVLLVRSEHRSVHPGHRARQFVERRQPVPRTAQHGRDQQRHRRLLEQEAEEVHRILLAADRGASGRAHEDLEADARRGGGRRRRPGQGRFSRLCDGIAPGVSADGRLELLAARHPLLIPAVDARVPREDDERARAARRGPRSGGHRPGAADVGAGHHGAEHRGQDGRHQDGRPARAHGAVRTAHPGGRRLAAAGLPVGLRGHRRRAVDRGEPEHVLVAHRPTSRHRSRADAALRWSCWTRWARAPIPVEGGALGMAVIEHFRKRGALRRRDDALRHAEDLRLDDGGGHVRRVRLHARLRADLSPHLRVAGHEPRARDGRPPRAGAVDHRHGPVLPQRARVAAGRAPGQGGPGTARSWITSAGWWRASGKRSPSRSRVTRAARSRCAQKEEQFRRRLESQLEDRLREARRGDRRASSTTSSGRPRRWCPRPRGERRPAPTPLSTGETGALRAAGRGSLDDIETRLRETVIDGGAAPGAAAAVAHAPTEVESRRPEPGDRVDRRSVGRRGRGPRRVRPRRRGRRPGQATARRDRPAAPPRTRQEGRGDARARERPDGLPRLGGPRRAQRHRLHRRRSGRRADKFLDEAIVAELRGVRLIHGHGTGQLRKGLAAYLHEHPMVARFGPAPSDQGGNAVTVVEFKE